METSAAGFAPQPPSRAGSLALVGGVLALDFCNTASGRGFPTHREHLREPRDVVDWAAHARALARDDADWLRSALADDAALGARLHGEALALREDVHALAGAIAAGRPAPSAGLGRLAASHARHLARAQLAPLEGHFVWTWPIRRAPVAATLGPVALSALTTLLQADLTRVKQCEGDRCGWLFFDSTKNRLRRWCEMEICGNRAKQRRRGAKSRGR